MKDNFLDSDPVGSSLIKIVSNYHLRDWILKVTIILITFVGMSVAAANEQPLVSSEKKCPASMYVDEEGDPLDIAESGVVENPSEVQAVALPNNTHMELVRRFAPQLRFDQEANTFPMDPQIYWDGSVQKDNHLVPKKGHISNSFLTNDLPTYFQIYTCGNKTRIIYNWFYGYQQKCDCCSGAHDADWERVMVTVDANGNMESVLYWQHSGWYTRRKGEFLTVSSNDPRPVVYVGKRSHGSYHDDGGTGTCCYWEDWRNQGKKKARLDTQNNLVQLLSEDGPTWMTYSGYWGNKDISGPLQKRSNYCTMKTCKGISTLSCTTSGCAKNKPPK